MRLGGVLSNADLRSVSYHLDSTPGTYVSKGEPYRYAGVEVVGFDALLPWLREQSNPPVEFERLARFSAGV